MPPKKKDADDKPQRQILQKFSHSLKAGLVGMPNAGKSSTFNSLTSWAKKSADGETLGALALSANYPFATIDPNEARCHVPDERFDTLVTAYKPKSVVPAHFSVTDIAGLVKGASSGQGLGNAFLSHIAAVDGIFHLVRVFEDEDVTHVEGDVDPIRDMDIITEELRMKDEQHMDTVISKHRVGALNSDKKLAAQVEIHKKIRSVLADDKKQIRHVEWNSKEIDELRTLNLITAKPVIYLVNLSVKDFERQKNKHLKRIKEWVDANSPGDPIIPFSAAFEEAVAAGEADLAKSMVPKIITQGYRHLNLISFFTCGADEVRQWTIRDGSTAPQAAGTIHTDFEKFFIQAEVIPYEDWKECGSEVEAKKQGKMKLSGKTYIVNDGDICHFKIGQGTKKK